MFLFDSSNYFEWYILSAFNCLGLSPRKGFFFSFFEKKNQILFFHSAQSGGLPNSGREESHFFSFLLF